jgi:hypothetical protein
VFRGERRPGPVRSILRLMFGRQSHCRPHPSASRDRAGPRPPLRMRKRPYSLRARPPPPICVSQRLAEACSCHSPSASSAIAEPFRVPGRTRARRQAWERSRTRH